MKFSRNLANFFIFACLTTSVAKADTFICKPVDASTAISFRGQTFKLIISNQCIDLRNLENNENWTWKVAGFNSLGDKDGTRKFCDKKDDGMTGNPAYWNQSSLRFYSFDTRKINEFKCFPDR